MGVDLDELGRYADFIDHTPGFQGLVREAIAEIRELREVEKVMRDRGWRGDDPTPPPLAESVGLLIDLIEDHQRDQERRNCEIAGLRAQVERDRQTIGFLEDGIAKLEAREPRP